MSYRSEEAAFAAELAQLEADAAAVTREADELEAELRPLRAARRARRLLALLSVGLALAVAFGSFRLAASRRAAAQQRAEVARLESEIRELEQRVDQLGRVQRIAESPLLTVLGGMGASADPELVAAVRAADPDKPEDAWWVVAHAACRLPHAELERDRALEKLGAERREKALAFCHKRP